MGGNFSVMDYIVWNEIPTVLGNLVGGLAFTGLTLYCHSLEDRAEEGVASGNPCESARTAQNLPRAALDRWPQGDQPGLSRRLHPVRAPARLEGHRHCKWPTA